jgi:hypothetical protein
MRKRVNKVKVAQITAELKPTINNCNCHLDDVALYITIVNELLYLELLKTCVESREWLGLEFNWQAGHLDYHYLNLSDLLESQSFVLQNFTEVLYDFFIINYVDTEPNRIHLFFCTKSKKAFHNRALPQFTSNLFLSADLLKGQSQT